MNPVVTLEWAIYFGIELFEMKVSLRCQGSPPAALNGLRWIS